jgi:hypothetical protein
MFTFLRQTIPGKTRLTIHSFLAALFAVKLREMLDVSIAGDKSDAAWRWGL